jgi:hypothetical protein
MAALTNPDPTTENLPRPRRWIPLSLRMFVALMLVLGNVIWIVVPAWTQPAAINEIRAGRVKGVRNHYVIGS